MHEAQGPAVTVLKEHPTGPPARGSASSSRREPHRSTPMARRISGGSGDTILVPVRWTSPGSELASFVAVGAPCSELASFVAVGALSAGSPAVGALASFVTV